MVGDLPTSLPIFPLTGALLLPKGQLPLNIFEPRYKAMFDHAFASNRLIGMIQPRDLDLPMGEAPVYDRGCAGRITAMSETDDGRYMITLTGVARFLFKSDTLHEGGFRIADVCFEDYKSDINALTDTAVDRENFMKVLTDYFVQQGFTANWQQLRETPTTILVNSLAMICPFESAEKQALLESKTDEARAQLLMALMEMGSTEAPADIAASTGSLH